MSQCPSDASMGAWCTRLSLGFVKQRVLEVGKRLKKNTLKKLAWLLLAVLEGFTTCICLIVSLNMQQDNREASHYSLHGLRKAQWLPRRWNPFQQVFAFQHDLGCASCDRAHNSCDSCHLGRAWKNSKSVSSWSTLRHVKKNCLNTLHIRYIYNLDTTWIQLGYNLDTTWQYLAALGALFDPFANFGPSFAKWFAKWFPRFAKPQWKESVTSCAVADVHLWIPGECIPQIGVTLTAIARGW